jgi:hypothetical protein
MPLRVPLGKCAEAGPGNFNEHYGLRRMRFYTFARNRVYVVLACYYNPRRAIGGLASQPREESFSERLITMKTPQTPPFQASTMLKKTSQGP